MNLFRYRCLEKRYEEENQWVLKYIDKTQGGGDTPPNTLRICQSDNVSVKNANDEEYKKYFHRTLDCPLYAVEKSHGDK